MILHNLPFTESEVIQPDTPFNTLRIGQRFNKGQLVFKRDETSITVKRADGWLVTEYDTDDSWGRLVKLQEK